MFLNEKIKLKKTNYYQIIHKKTQEALYIGSSSSDFKSQKALLTASNPESLGQVWLIVEVDNHQRPGLYQIVHARSTLVLESLRQGFFMRAVDGTEKNQMRLRFGNWQKDQLFYLDQPDAGNFPNVYCFRAEKYSKDYIFYDNFLKCDEIDPSNEACHWQIRLCHENPVINRSCYFENAFSTLVMDVPAASLKSGQMLIQYTFNNRFNQRFNIYRRGEYYVIENLNSKMYLGIKNNIGEVDVPIVQCKNNTNQGQWWKIEYQGKSLYTIRSVLKSKLLLGIKDDSMNIETYLVTTMNEEMALWKIVGFLPK